MNKTKMILSVTGGIILVAVLAMAFMTWMSFSAKVAAREGDDESGTDGLDTVMERAHTLSAKKPYPCAASVKQISSNREEIVLWKEDALKLAVRGDRPIVATTPAAFKEFIVGDAKRIATLPAAAGPLVAADFDFGPFKDYISGGKMPAESELAALQRKWDDVATVAETLSSCGITRLTGIAFKDAVPAPDAHEDNSRKGARRKKPAQKANAKDEQAPTGPATCTYVISFLAKPPAFVKCVNALATSERFMVVDDFSFVRESDAIATALGGGDKKEAQAATSSRRRRGRRGAEAEEAKDEAEAAKGGIVTDPVLDPPLAVTMTISVYDFKSLEETKEAGK